MKRKAFSIITAVLAIASTAVESILPYDYTTALTASQHSALVLGSWASALILAVISATLTNNNK